MQKIVSMAFILCLIAGVFSGCGGRDQSTGPETGETDAGPSYNDDQPQIALIMKSLANEFFKTMEEGARTHHAAHSNEYNLIAQGIKNELDVSRQVDLVEQMIARGVDAIVIAPADSKALVGVSARALNEGIIVVNIDNRLDEEVLATRGVKIPFVGPDNREGARLVGEYLASRLEHGDAVGVIEGVPTAYNAIQRRLGFEDAMKAGGMRIVASQSARWEMAEANQVASAMLSAHPEIKGLLCANDSMALGAVAALREANKAGEVLTIGYDNISAAQELIKNGAMLATIDQHADQLAVYGIEYALDMIKKGGIPEDRQTPVHLITADTLQQVP